MAGSASARRGRAWAETAMRGHLAAGPAMLLNPVVVTDLLPTLDPS